MSEKMERIDEPLGRLFMGLKLRPPLTLRALLMGAILSIFVGMYSAFAGLKIGGVYWPILTTSLVALALLKLFGKTDPNEVNILQTAANTGGLLAAGLIFTIPAIWMLGMDISTWDIFWISIIGGGIGLAFSVPLRKQMIERDKLPYPDGAAAASLIKAGDRGGKHARWLFGAIGVGAAFSFIRDYLAWIPAYVNLETLKSSLAKPFSLGSSISLIPFAGGYLIGPRFTFAWFLGAIATYFLIVPYFLMLGASDKFSVVIETAKPIGVGIVFGAAIAYFILHGLRALSIMLKEWDKAKQSRIAGMAIIVATGILTIITEMNVVLAVFAMMGAFVMAFVAARVTGEMNVDPLEIFAFLVMLIAKIVFGFNALYLVVLAAIVAIAAGTAGDVMQDLKTGHILKTRPEHQIVAQLVGLVSAAIVLGTVLFALQYTYGIGSVDLPAPQAVALKEILSQPTIPLMMQMGIVLGIVLTLFTNYMGWGIASIAFGIGMYVPIELSFPLFIGGLIRHVADKRQWTEKGRVLSAGAIAGEGIVGVALALMAFAALFIL
ncbi:OPT/YSL family transporter [Candidatus Micrarchaeota archaeon]|nr:OPT/YSL family transporter [Candidatus Micrarchaeota archaeon]